MRLYRRFIRPLHCYPGQGYEPKTEPVEKIEIWYPEEERERLEKKYGYLNEEHFSNLIFEEKYLLFLLKDQEPIKPTINEDGEAYCVCGENVGIIPNSKNLPKVCSKYCPECGRKMIWEEVTI